MILIIVYMLGLAFGQGQPVSADDPTAGKLYEWQDEQGTLNVTDRLEKVPKEYRSSVKVRDVEVPVQQGSSAPDQASGTQQQNQPWTAPSTQNEEALKRSWQLRIQKARDDVTRLTTQLQLQEAQLKDLQERGGGGYYYTTEMAAQVKELELKIQDTKNALEQARNVVNEDIPDAARKAGIPPGWLRE